jgi:hypothetical protein
VRLIIVTLLAGLALLSGIGAAVMFMFWDEARDGLLLASQRERAWNMLSVLHTIERAVAYVLIGVVSIWTFLTVLNVRLATGRRRNPILAAASWPAAGIGLWVIGDRLVHEQPAGSVVMGFVAQAVVLYVPFLLLERAAEAVGARRTPLRIVYGAGVVLLVYIQGLGGLSNIAETGDTAQYGRLAGYLLLGALVQLLSTLAVTDASSVIAVASARGAEHHNFLMGQRPGPEQRPPIPTPVAGA